MIWDDQTFGN